MRFFLLIPNPVFARLFRRALFFQQAALSAMIRSLHGFIPNPAGFAPNKCVREITRYARFHAPILRKNLTRVSLFLSLFLYLTP
jgi:hypothetical protein